jgi:hypothetical protein
VTEEEALEELNRFMTETFPHYVLDGHTPVKATDFLSFMAWYEQADRHVAHDFGEGWELSTVFLGVAVHHPRDMQDVLPPLFETALFGEGADTNVLERYDTWEDAEHGHAQFLRGLTVPKEPYTMTPRIRRGRG